MYEIWTVWHGTTTPVERSQLPETTSYDTAMDVAKSRALAISPTIKKSNDAFLARTKKGGPVIACVSVERPHDDEEHTT